jgi:methanogenic corrinoid protein MtbC1
MTHMAPTDPDLAPLTTAVAALDEKKSLRLVAKAVDSGLSSRTILRAVQEGMRIVGERYEAQEVFLAGLIMAGEIFRAVMDMVRSDWESSLDGGASGRVLLGTVAGDIHDLGKNMAALTFRTYGFAVEDLGVDVPPEDFVAAARRTRPDVVGLSGLLTVAFDSMRETVQMIRADSTEGAVPLIVIGGATIDEHIARYIGADQWTNDAMEGVRVCQKLLESRTPIARS